MSFTVNFYTSTANPKKLDKTGDITIIGTAKTINAKHQIDIISPVFTVDYNADLLAANYCYIAEYGRYYFCTIATDTAQKITATCTVDPLFSFATAIKNCPCTVVRSESAGVNNVIDNKLPIDSRKIWISGADFPNDPLKILTTDLYRYLLITNS